MNIIIRETIDAFSPFPFQMFQYLQCYTAPERNTFQSENHCPLG